METTSYKYDGLKRLAEENVSVGNTVVNAYTDGNGNYTTLIQKETRTVEVADCQSKIILFRKNLKLLFLT